MSKISIIKRVRKTIFHLHGCQSISQIPGDKVCVFCVGGDGIRDKKSGNGNAKIVKNMLDFRLGKSISVYAAVYSFDEYNTSHNERENNFIKHRQNTLSSLEEDKEILSHMSSEIENQQYMEDFFNAVLLPRISQKGKRLSLNDACRRIRKITFSGDCHGGYVFFKLEEIMQQKMKELNYSLEERKQIQSQLLCVAQASACPLGISKSSFYNFYSVNDFISPKSQIARFGNNLFNNYIFNMLQKQKEIMNKQDVSERKRFFNPCYFEKQKLFMYETKYPYWPDVYMIRPEEHGDTSFGNEYQTMDAQMMNTFRALILINGVKNSFQQGEEWVALPPIEELIRDEDVDAEMVVKYMEKLKSEGKKIYKKIIDYAYLQRNLQRIVR